jgi:hypothetical protein
MIAEPMHISLSLDLVSWRANLWARERRRPDEHETVDDDPFTLRNTGDDAAPRDDEPSGEPSRFVRQPVRVVYTPHSKRDG